MKLFMLLLLFATAPLSAAYMLLPNFADAFEPDLAEVPLCDPHIAQKFEALKKSDPRILIEMPELENMLYSQFISQKQATKYIYLLKAALKNIPALAEMVLLAPISHEYCKRALIWAIHTGHNAITEIIGKSGMVTEEDYSTILRRLIKDDRLKNDKQCAHILKAAVTGYAKENIHERYENGFTPLHEAARCDNIIAMQVLVQNGADITARTNDGKTVLDMAQEYKSTDVICWILNLNFSQALKRFNDLRIKSI